MAKNVTWFLAIAVTLVLVVIGIYERFGTYLDLDVRQENQHLKIEKKLPPLQFDFGKSPSALKSSSISFPRSTGDRIQEYHQDLARWLKPVFPEKKKFDGFSIMSPEPDSKEVVHQSFRIQEALKVLQSEKIISLNFAAPTGLHTVFEFDYSKSWMLAGHKNQTSDDQIEMEKEEHEDCDALIQNKVGFVYEEKEISYLRKILDDLDSPNILQFGGTGISTIISIKKGQKLFSVERDRPTCFAVANCLWSLQTTQPIEFYYQCETKESRGSASTFAQYKSYANFLSKVPEFEKIEKIDVVLVSGEAQLASALKSLKFMHADSLLFLFNPSFPKAKEKSFLDIYFQIEKEVGNLKVFSPKDSFVGMEFADKDIHFLHFITYKTYANGKYHVSLQPKQPK